MNPNLIELIPKDISLSVVPVRRTVKWTDEDGIKHIKRNQIAVRVDFTGIYDNDFLVGSILFDWENNQTFIAVTKNTIRNVIDVMDKFIIPKKVVIQGSVYIHKNI